MDIRKDILENLTDNVLIAIFKEYEELKETGILKKGIARNIELKFRKENSIRESCLEYIREEIYREMARRYYNQKIGEWKEIEIKKYEDDEEIYLIKSLECVYE